MAYFSAHECPIIGIRVLIAYSSLGFSAKCYRKTITTVNFWSYSLWTPQATDGTYDVDIIGMCRFSPFNVTVQVPFVYAKLHGFRDTVVFPAFMGA